MLSSTRRGPNPFLLLGLILASGGTFYFVVKRREATHPASKQPLQRAHPLVPPRQHDHQDTD
ncbi:hypothetical protein EV363DRAFT_724944 [Boletus edulis]|uniref:Uncharacterized protein n=1 Tax=Boletus edulis BED1 TaxID=1328754 RepID=A0AAD4C422_BOLED|nr:hypothetical protein EV363DRAFT_718986 [Boletus edulis]KAF8136231.1 hypothetical protein EV363DRAFT_724944 [Boletus edulis]KAF8448089.1 hypothetical protein L210DRAFT_849160 [Boletus edulis BED1]